MLILVYSVYGAKTQLLGDGQQCMMCSSSCYGGLPKQSAIEVCGHPPGNHHHHTVQHMTRTGNHNIR